MQVLVTDNALQCQIAETITDAISEPNRLIHLRFCARTATESLVQVQRKQSMRVVSFIPEPRLIRTLSQTNQCQLASHEFDDCAHSSSNMQQIKYALQIVTRIKKSGHERSHTRQSIPTGSNVR